MKAGIYIRVSTAQQEDGTSLGTQLERCRAEAERMGYAVDEGFVWCDTRRGQFHDQQHLGAARQG